MRDFRIGRDVAVHVQIFRLDICGSFPDIVAQHKNDPDRYGNVRNDKVGSVPVTFGEDLPTVENEDDERPKDYPVSGPRLPSVVVAKNQSSQRRYRHLHVLPSLTVDPLRLDSLLESEIGETNGRPGDVSDSTHQMGVRTSMRTAYRAFRLLSQLRTLAAPLERDMKDKPKKSETKHNETIGNPRFVVRARIGGAWPRSAIPYSIRLTEYIKELPAEVADVSTAPLMM